MTKKKLYVLIAVILAIMSCGIISASGVKLPTGGAVDGACEEHLLQNCTQCSETMVLASYRRYCQRCGTVMTRCCTYDIKDEDIESPCYSITHPDGCVNIQDWCWNYYFCTACGFNQAGVQSDDTHLESYYHTMCNCEDNIHGDHPNAHAYCSLPDLSDLQAQYAAAHGLSTEDIVSPQKRTSAPDYDEAVIAGDYCEVHDRFGCDILIEE